MAGLLPLSLSLLLNGELAFDLLPGHTHSLCESSCEGQQLPAFSGTFKFQSRANSCKVRAACVGATSQQRLQHVLRATAMRLNSAQSQHPAAGLKRSLIKAACDTGSPQQVNSKSSYWPSSPAHRPPAPARSRALVCLAGRTTAEPASPPHHAPMPAGPQRWDARSQQRKPSRAHPAPTQPAEPQQHMCGHKKINSQPSQTRPASTPAPTPAQDARET